MCLTHLQEWGGVELNFVIWALLEFRDPLVFDPLEETNLCQADEDPSQQCPFSEGFIQDNMYCIYSVLGFIIKGLCAQNNRYDKSYLGHVLNIRIFELFE